MYAACIYETLVIIYCTATECHTSAHDGVAVHCREKPRCYDLYQLLNLLPCSKPIGTSWSSVKE